MACVDLRGTRLSKYFRTGAYTHFSMREPWVNGRGQTVVSWSYCYMDLGMWNEISKSFLVTPGCDGVGYWVREDAGCEASDNVVDALEWFARPWAFAADGDRLRDALFDHYKGERGAFH